MRTLNRRTLEARGRTAGQAGFSLVELVIALSIVVIAAVGGFASHHTSRNLLRTSEETARAVADLENCMERILVESVDALLDPDSPYPADTPIPAFQDANLTAETIVPTYPSLPAVGLPDVLEIRLTVTWLSFDQRTRTITLRTSKAR